MSDIPHRDADGVNLKCLMPSIDHEGGVMEIKCFV